MFTSLELLITNILITHYADVSNEFFIRNVSKSMKKLINDNNMKPDFKLLSLLNEIKDKIQNTF
jgi:hypothetical protein